MQFGKAHCVEFEAGKLLQAFEVGNSVAGIFMNIHDFGRQIDQVGEEVTELFDGIEAFPAAVIGHKQVLDACKVFRDDKDRTFGMAKGFPQVLVGLSVVGPGIEMLCADEDQIRETAFFDEQVFVPLAVIFVQRIG